MAPAAQGSAQQERPSAAGAEDARDVDQMTEALAATAQSQEETAHAAGAKRSRDEKAPAATSGPGDFAAGAEGRMGKISKRKCNEFIKIIR